MEMERISERKQNGEIAKKPETVSPLFAGPFFAGIRSSAAVALAWTAENLQSKPKLTFCLAIYPGSIHLYLHFLPLLLPLPTFPYYFPSPTFTSSWSKQTFFLVLSSRDPKALMFAHCWRGGNLAKVLLPYTGFFPFTKPGEKTNAKCALLSRQMRQSYCDSERAFLPSRASGLSESNGTHIEPRLYIWQVLLLPPKYTWLEIEDVTLFDSEFSLNYRKLSQTRRFLYSRRQRTN